MAKSKLPPHDPETGEIRDYVLPGVGEPASAGQDPVLKSQGKRPVALDGYGREIPDPTPLAPPIGHKPRASMVDIIRAQIRSHHLAVQAEAEGYETFDEADDFDVDDDFDPTSPYEEMFDPPPPRQRFHSAESVLYGVREARGNFVQDPRPPLPRKQPEKPADKTPTPAPAEPKEPASPKS